MELITKVVSNYWPILLVFVAILVIGAVGIFLWNRRRSKGRTVTAKDSTGQPAQSSSDFVHGVIFHNGTEREMEVSRELILSTSRPLFPRMMGNKKVIFLERIPEGIPLTLSPAQVENKGNGGNGKKNLDFLEVLGQKKEESPVTPEAPKQRRKRKAKNAKHSIEG